MTHPKPVTAYAAVSPDGRIDHDVIGLSEETCRSASYEWYEDGSPLTFIPVTIIPTEQYEWLLSLVFKYVPDNPPDTGREKKHIGELIAALKEQDHG